MEERKAEGILYRIAEGCLRVADLGFLVIPTKAGTHEVARRPAIQRGWVVLGNLGSTHFHPHPSPLHQGKGGFTLID